MDRRHFMAITGTTLTSVAHDWLLEPGLDDPRRAEAYFRDALSRVDPSRPRARGLWLELLAMRGCGSASLRQYGGRLGLRRQVQRAAPE